MNDFYVGYLPKAPTALAAFVRRVIVVLGLVVVTMALILVVAQKRFANSTFEYGKLRSFEGVVVTQKVAVSLAAIAACLLTAGAAIAGPAPISVPEPMSLTLFAGGIGALAVVRYLRKK